MRSLLVFLSCLALAGVLAHALAVVAPAIEARIDGAAEVAAAEATVHPASVVTRGRDIRISTTVDSEEARAALIDALVRVPGAGRVDPEITVLPRADPYVLVAERGADGAVRLSGSVPTEAVERKVIDAARAISPGKAVTSALVLASGAPEGDWPGLVAAGLAALGHAKEGRVEVEGLSGRIVARVADEAARASAETALAAAGAERWTAEIALVLPVAAPYAFRAERTADGVRVAGVAPDAAARERFRRLAGENAEGEIALAEGMPDAEWPGLVRRALLAFALLEEGSVAVEDLAVALEGRVADAAAAARVREMAGAGWRVALTVPESGPPPTLVVTVTPGGEIAAEGVLPEGLTPAELRREVPELGAGDGIEAGGAPAALPWDPAFEALALVLPKIATGRIEIGDGVFRAEGRLAPGFSAQAARSAVRAVLGPGWETALELADAPPAAELLLTKDAAGLRLAGILPEGVEVETALVRAGGADAAGITGGGAREDRDWRAAIDATVRVLAAYETAEGRIGGGRIALDGRLVPGHRREELADVLGAAVGGTWEVAVAGDETAVPDGSLRPSARGRGEERLSAGRWLPVLGFAPDPATCAAESGAPDAGGALAFAPGRAEFEGAVAGAPDAAGTARLDRLAAVMLRCIEAGGLAVTITGHTDATGEAEANLRLSEERALAVRDAMALRGVPLDAMRTEGLGDTAPVASNETEEGRARNRRIEFVWAARAVPDAAVVEAVAAGPGAAAGAGSGAADAPGGAAGNVSPPQGAAAAGAGSADPLTIVAGTGSGPVIEGAVPAEAGALAEAVPDAVAEGIGAVPEPLEGAGALEAGAVPQAEGSAGTGLAATPEVVTAGAAGSAAGPVEAAVAASEATDPGAGGDATAGDEPSAAGGSGAGPEIVPAPLPAEDGGAAEASPAAGGAGTPGALPAPARAEAPASTEDPAAGAATPAGGSAPRPSAGGIEPAPVPVPRAGAETAAAAATPTAPERSLRPVRRPRTPDAGAPQ